MVKPKRVAVYARLLLSSAQWRSEEGQLRSHFWIGPR
jgi:hypothetical protein